MTVDLSVACHPVSRRPLPNTLGVLVFTPDSMVVDASSSAKNSLPFSIIETGVPQCLCLCF